MKGLGDRLYHLRKKHQLTTTELAAQVKVSLQELKQWEQGQKRPPIHKLSELSEIYEVDLEQLVPNRILVNKQLSTILKDIEGGRGTLYFKKTTSQPFYPQCIVKNVRVIEVKAGAMKIQIHQNNRLTRHILAVDDVLGFLEEVN